MNHPDSIPLSVILEPLVFSDIVTGCQDMVYNAVLGIIQNETEAEDITQDVFVQVYEGLDEFRNESKLSTWIYRIAISKALDFEKKKKRQKNGGFLKKIFSGAAEEEAVSFNHPGILLDKKDDARILFAAMNKLPEKQRIAFMLHKLEGLNYQEIADVMHLSLMAVESLQVRAKNRLKELLKTYYTTHFK
ncbi:MAG: polymerase subunit sigma-70 [Ferruginibacter sp.]|nr:polymerase subunit sigma-70 [Ferruginibacter sp.]